MPSSFPVLTVVVNPTMHELSLAINIIKIVTEEMGRIGTGRVAAVHLQLGPLSGVVPESLRMAFRLATEQTTFAGTDLVIEEVPITVNCTHCQAERAVNSLQNMICSVCGLPSHDIVTGRELEVSALEIVQDDPRDSTG